MQKPFAKHRTKVCEIRSKHAELNAMDNEICSSKCERHHWKRRSRGKSFKIGWKIGDTRRNQRNQRKRIRSLLVRVTKTIFMTVFGSGDEDFGFDQYCDSDWAKWGWENCNCLRISTSIRIQGKLMFYIFIIRFLIV